MAEEDLDAVVEAVLGRPLALTILTELERGPLDLPGLAARLGAEEHHVAREVKRLTAAGLVAPESGGHEARYRVRAPGWQELRAALADLARRSFPDAP